jgi:hypothetical protein
MTSWTITSREIEPKDLHLHFAEEFQNTARRHAETVNVDSSVIIQGKTIHCMNGVMTITTARNDSEYRRETPPPSIPPRGFRAFWQNIRCRSMD